MFEIISQMSESITYNEVKDKCIEIKKQEDLVALKDLKGKGLLFSMPDEFDLDKISLKKDSKLNIYVTDGKYKFTANLFTGEINITVVGNTLCSLNIDATNSIVKFTSNKCMIGESSFKVKSFINIGRIVINRYYVGSILKIDDLYILATDSIKIDNTGVLSYIILENKELGNLKIIFNDKYARADSLLKNTVMIRGIDCYLFDKDKVSKLDSYLLFTTPKTLDNKNDGKEKENGKEKPKDSFTILQIFIGFVVVSLVGAIGFYVYKEFIQNQ